MEQWASLSVGFRGYLVCLGDRLQPNLKQSVLLIGGQTFCLLNLQGRMNTLQMKQWNNHSCKVNIKKEVRHLHQMWCSREGGKSCSWLDAQSHSVTPGPGKALCPTEPSHESNQKTPTVEASKCLSQTHYWHFNVTENTQQIWGSFSFCFKLKFTLSCKFCALSGQTAKKDKLSEHNYVIFVSRNSNVLLVKKRWFKKVIQTVNWFIFVITLMGINI